MSAILASLLKLDGCVIVRHQQLSLLVCLDMGVGWGILRGAGGFFPTSASGPQIWGKISLVLVSVLYKKNFRNFTQQYQSYSEPNSFDFFFKVFANIGICLTLSCVCMITYVIFERLKVYVFFSWFAEAFCGCVMSVLRVIFISTWGVNASRSNLLMTALRYAGVALIHQFEQSCATW